MKIKFLNEFKQFAMRGNVIDLAVGVIIGAAFGKITNSLVGDIIMPPIGVLVGGVNFTDLVITLKQASVSATGEVIPAVTINYGSFIQTVIDFLIIAFTIFIFIKLINKLNRQKPKETPATPPTPPADAFTNDTKTGSRKPAACFSILR